MSTKEILNKVDNIRAYINKRVFEREAETDSAIIAIVSGESCLYIGDAGAAKTQHVQILSTMMGLSLFDVLMSETTKPDTIFGPVDVPALAKGTQRFKIEGYAPTSEILFFDEVFKANAVVLNPLLGLLNEHTFRNGDEGVIQCPTVAVFAASNEIPTDQGSRPIYDRFLIRHEVKYLRSRDSLKKLYNAAINQLEEPVPEKLTREEVATLTRLSKQVHVPEDLWETMLNIRDQVKRSVGVEISDRRMYKALRVVQASSLLNHRSVASSTDLEVLANIFWDQQPQIRKVQAIVLSNTGSVVGDALSYVEMADSVFEKAMKTGEVKEGFMKMKSILQITKQFTTTVGKKIHLDVLDKAKSLRDTLKKRDSFEIIKLYDADGKPWYKLSEATANVWTTKQIRAAGFKFRRKAGYWYIGTDVKVSEQNLIKRITKLHKTVPVFHNIGDM